MYIHVDFNACELEQFFRFIFWDYRKAFTGSVAESAELVGLP